MASDSRLLERLNLGTIRPLYLSAGDTKMRVEVKTEAEEEARVFARLREMGGGTKTDEEPT